MELVLQNTKAVMLESLNIIFIKWWQVGTGLIATWLTALFGGRLLLFVPPTPENLKVWIPIVTTLLVSIVTILFLYRSKNKELKNIERKAEQDLMQDEMEDCRKMWLSFLENNRIPDTMTLVDFKKEHYDKIKLAFKNN